MYPDLIKGDVVTDLEVVLNMHGRTNSGFSGTTFTAGLNFKF
jgi:hypothetical protein